jgi:NAD(P)-dependent dehydrogenase (short-subunit alcohol dehydrogenase family)
MFGDSQVQVYKVWKVQGGCAIQYTNATACGRASALFTFRFVFFGMLPNKNVVIIGGTAGLGLSAARAFVGHGARVVVIGRDEATSKEAGKLLGTSGVALVGDAAQPECAVEAINECVKRFGPLHGLYHVAGGSGRRMGDGPLHDLTLDGWKATFDLNLTSLMFSNQAAVRVFRAQGAGGTILNMSSVLAYSPAPEHFSTHAYAAAKGAVISLSKAMASYYARDDIRVNVIAPGLVDTPMATRAANDASIMNYIKSKQPLDNGRIGLPGDLDGLAVYFMSDQSRFTTGQVIAVDGGWSVSEGQV